MQASSRERRRGLYVVRREGLPAPRRRTLATALQSLRSLDADFAPPSMAPLVSNAGSWGTGSPSLRPRFS